MDDRNVVVFLGGTSGILQGREAINEVLRAARPRRPWHIILGSRMPTRAPFGAQYVPDTNEPTRDIVACLPLDLARLSSVRTFAAQLEKYLPGAIDTLVLCAGAVCANRRVTEDGYEETIQVNSLAEALMVDLLWPKLRGHAEGRKSRILFVASVLHIGAAKRMEYCPSRDLADQTRPDKRLTPSALDAHPPNPYKPMSAYADSKLLLMHVFFLACSRSESDPERVGPEVLALSPGFIPFTGLVRESSCLARWAMKWIMPCLPFARSPQQAGAFLAHSVTRTWIHQTHSGLHEDTPLLPRSGTYFSISKGEMRAAPECYDVTVREEWCTMLQVRGLWGGSPNEP